VVAYQCTFHDEEFGFPLWKISSARLRDVDRGPAYNLVPAAILSTRLLSPRSSHHADAVASGVARSIAARGIRKPGRRLTVARPPFLADLEGSGLHCRRMARFQCDVRLLGTKPSRNQVHDRHDSGAGYWVGSRAALTHFRGCRPATVFGQFLGRPWGGTLNQDERVAVRRANAPNQRGGKLVREEFALRQACVVRSLLSIFGVVYLAISRTHYASFAGGITLLDTCLYTPAKTDYDSIVLSPARSPGAHHRVARAAARGTFRSHSLGYFSRLSSSGKYIIYVHRVEYRKTTQAQVARLARERIKDRVVVWQCLLPAGHFR